MTSLADGIMARPDYCWLAATFAEQRASSQPGGRSSAAVRDQGVRDHTGALGQWFTDHALQVALVRPDCYIFGGGALTLLPTLTEQMFAMLLSPASLDS